VRKEQSGEPALGRVHLVHLGSLGAVDRDARFRRKGAVSRQRAVEREFGRLKGEWALAPLRVRRIERVRLHADLTIIAKLSRALAKARAVPLAA
jgi:hypothetical protein